MDPTLEIATQIRDMIQSQNQLYMAQARLLRGQLAAMEAIAEASGNVDMSRLNSGFDEAERQIQAAETAMQNLANTSSSTMSGMASGATKAGNSVNGLAGSLNTAGTALQRMGIGAAMMEGFGRGIDTAISTLGGLSGIIGTIGEQMLNLGSTIFAQVLSPFEALFSLAASKGAPSSDLRKAYEELRKTFGDLSSNEGAAVIRMFKSLGSTLGDTGLRTRRILGMPADQLRAMTELAKGFGSQFNMVFNQGLIENAGNIVGFKKALDLSDESMKTAARQAAVTGRTLDEVLTESANYAIQLGDAFGMSSMEISRGMQEMENDMKHFGGLSKKTLAETTVYAKKLGIEVKTLSGIMDAFDNFDSAADAAARLNQQFGIQLDTLEMLREEDPARRADMLRDSLNSAGVSYANLDRRSKSYLASQLQISEAEAELLFNEKNRGLSLDQIKKKSGEAEKKQLTQVEVMDRLADSIERLVRQGSAMEGGIFANFFKGFTEGILNSREFRGLMRDITQIFQSAIRYGRQLGRAFVDLFPGIQTIIGGFRDLFNPQRWRKTFGEIVDAFKSFFRTIQTNPEAGMRTLFERLKAIFFNNFDASKSGGSKLIEGFKTFFGTILRVMLSAVRVIVPELMKAVRDGIRYVNDLINGRAGGGGFDLGGLITELSSLFGEIITSLGEVISTGWERYGDDILTALQDLWTSVTNRLGPWLKDHWQEILIGIGVFFAGPALVGALSSGLGAMITSTITNLMGSFGMGGGGGGAAAAAGAASAATGATGAIGAAANTAASAVAATNPLTTLAASAGAIGAGFLALGEIFDQIFELAKKLQDNNISASNVAAAVGIVAVGGLLIGGLITVLTNIDLDSFSKLAGLLAGGALAAGIGIFAGGVIDSFARAIMTFASPGGALDSLIAGVGAIADKMKNIPNFGDAISGLGSLMSGIAPLATAIATMAASGAFSDLGTAAAGIISGGASLDIFGIPVVGFSPNAPAPPPPPRNPLSDALSIITQLFGILASEIPRLINATDLVANIPEEQLKTRFKAVEIIAGLLGETIVPAVTSLKEAANSFSSASAGTTATTYDFTGVTTVITTLMTSVGSLITGIFESVRNISPERIKAVGQMGPVFEGISTVLATVGNMLNALKSSTTTNTTSGGLLSGASNTVNQVSNSFSSIDMTMFDSIFTSIGTLITTMLEGTQVFTGISPDDVSARAKALAVITETALGGVNTTLATILNPEIYTILSSPDATTKLDTIRSFIADISRNMFDPDPSVGMLGSVNELIGSILSLAIDPAQVPLLQSVSQLMGTVFEGLTSLATIIAGLTENPATQNPPTPAATSRLTEFATNIGTIFQAFTDVLPTLVSSIDSAFKGVSMERLIARTRTLNIVLEAFQHLFNFSREMDAFNSANTASAGKGGNTAPVVAGLTRLNNLFKGETNFFTIVQNVIDGIKGLDLKGLPRIGVFRNLISSLEALTSISSSMQSLSTNMSGLDFDSFAASVGGGVGQGMSTTGLIGVVSLVAANLGAFTADAEVIKGIRAFNRVSTPITSAFEHLSAIAGVITPITEGITDETRNRVSDLIGTITDTVTAIQSVSSVDLSTTLRALSDNLGLGRTASYTIDNENFNLTINMSVYIKAEEMERIFYNRANDSNWTEGARFKNESFKTPPPQNITPGSQ